MATWSRETLAAFGLGICLAWGTVAPEAKGQASTKAVKKIYHKSRAFRIPLAIDAEARPRIREVYLCVSVDAGATWQEVGKATPDQPSFSYKAPQDGEYWIAVQTLDTKGRLYPPSDAAIEPSMKVVVDTTPRRLCSLRSVGGGAGLRCAGISATRI